MTPQFIKKILSNKIWLTGAVVLVLALGYGGYKYFFSGNPAPQYVSSQIQKGTIVASVSGTGQVSNSSQIDIKSKVSGDVVYIGARNGQEAGSGQLLLQLDDVDAQKALRDARTNLDSAKLALEKLKEPPDAYSLLQAENAVAQAKDSRKSAQDNLQSAYEDRFNSVANTFVDLPPMMSGLQDILFSTALSGGLQQNVDYYSSAVQSYDSAVLTLRDDVRDKYNLSRQAYDKNFSDYKLISRFSDQTTIAGITNETYQTSKLIADALKGAANLIQFYQDKLTEHNLKINPASNTQLASLNAFVGQINSHLSSLLSIQNSIQSYSDAVTAAERSISEKQAALDKLKAGPDVLDIQSAELTVKQRENALLDAKKNLDDYYIRAPFEGIVAKINFDKAETVAAGASAATFIVKRQIAEISLNEVDAAKIKIGQKTTLTFDAVPDLTLTGKVTEVDTIGTVSQGVVSYNVKIALDAQNDKIKPAMSVSASIITEVKQDILLAPNAAVKFDSAGNYVEVLVNGAPQKKNVKTGISNDKETEIISGVNEGDAVITQTIASNSQSAQSSQQSSIFRLPGTGGR